MNSLQQHATRYVENGLGPLALQELGHTLKDGKPSGKNPDPKRAPNGVHSATWDVDEAETTFADKTTGGIGLAMGPQGDSDEWIGCLDVDRHTPEADGFKALATYEAKHGQLPDTPAQRSGTGMHYFFRIPRGTKTIKRLEDKIGLALLSKGRYVAAAPTVHPETKTEYAWLPGMSPGEVDFAPIPKTLLEYAGNGKAPLSYTSTGKGGPVADAPKVKEGGRNNALASIAGKWRRQNMSPAALESALLVENQERCAPPLPDEEVRQIARSVGRYEPANLLPIGNISPAPENVNSCLQIAPPSWDNVQTSDVAGAIKGTLLEDITADLAFVFKPALPLEYTLTKALVLAGSMLSQPKAGYDPENPPPGERGHKLLRLVVDTCGGTACNVYALSVLESAGGKDAGGGVPRLAGENYIGSGGSGEGMVEHLKPHPAGILTIAEFVQYLDDRGWRASVAAILTETFNQGFFKDVLTKKRGGDRDVPLCYPSIMAHVQPATLEHYGKRLSLESGFLGRFLICRPQPRKHRVRTSGCDFRRAQQALDAYTKPAGVVDIPQDFLNDLYNEMYDGHAPAAPLWKRLIEEYGPRFAVMLAVQPDGTLPPLNDDHWQRAGVLIRWFYRMGAEVLGCLGVSAEDRELQNRIESHFAWLKKRGGMATFSDCATAWGGNAHRRRSDIEEMHDRGWIDVCEEGRARVIRVRVGS